MSTGDSKKPSVNSFPYGTPKNQLASLICSWSPCCDNVTLLSSASCFIQALFILCKVLLLLQSTETPNCSCQLLRVQKLGNAKVLLNPEQNSQVFKMFSIFPDHSYAFMFWKLLLPPSKRLVFTEAFYSFQNTIHCFQDIRTKLKRPANLSPLYLLFSIETLKNILRNVFC